jgi:20S proteasome alpha/beta subunit
MIAVKPIPRPNVQRIPKRSLPMTLIAAFRTGNGGILLCADREENDTFAKRQSGKISRVNLSSGSIFLAGSGPSGVVTRTYADIEESLTQAEASGKDIARDHKSLIESCLKAIHTKYAANLRNCFLGLIIVFVPSDQASIPLLYRTELAMLIPEPFYIAYGAGKTIADYLSDRLYGEADQLFGHVIDNQVILAIALFIFREVANSVDGVGSGADMYLIRATDSASVRQICSDVVKELQEKVPAFSDSVFAHWKRRVRLPKRITD